MFPQCSKKGEKRYCRMPGACAQNPGRAEGGPAREEITSAPLPEPEHNVHSNKTARTPSGRLHCHERERKPGRKEPQRGSM